MQLSVRKWFDEAWGTCLAFSPDGRLLAEADTKGVLVWDVASGRQVQKFTGHAAPVASLFFSPKGDQVIAGDEKDVIRWWDRGTGKAVRESRGVLLGASADGNVVAIHRGKGRISLCDIVQAKEVRHFPFPGKYLGCAGYCPYPPAALSANGEVLVTTEGSTALLLNTRSGRWADFSRGHTDKVVFVGFSADGKQVISAGDTAVLVWDAQSGQYLHQLRNEWELIGAACMTADRRLLATGVADGSVRLWDLASGRQVRRMPIPGTFWPLPVFSPDGKQLAVNVRYAGRDTAIRLFQTNTGKDLSGFSADNNQGGLAFLPNGKALVGLDYSLRIFDAAEGTILLDCKEMCTQGIQTGLSVSSDGRFAATGCPKDRPPSGNIPSGIALWEFLTGTRIARLEGHEGPVTALALSQDGRWLATGGWEGTVRLWEVPSGKEVASRRGHRGRVLALAWSADDNFLASGSADTSVLLWDMSALRKAPGVQERRLREDEANKLWTLLSSREAGPASKALWQFVASPADAVPFLRQRLERPEATEQEIKLLVAALDDAKFEARVRATSELEAVGGKAEKALQSALRAKPTPESRRRLDELLAKLRAPAPRYSGQQLREIRAVQILEYIASPTACAVLRGVVQRRRGTFLATEASTALERAEKRGKGLPAGGKH